MTKAEFVEKIATKSSLDKTVADKVLNTILDMIGEVLRDEGKLVLPNLGTFSIGERQERQGRNPRTGEPLTIPACKVVKFHPCKQLKEAVQ